MAENFEFFAVKYTSHQRTQAANYVDPPNPCETMPMNYFVWAAVSAERTFVIDTGFTARATGRRGQTFLRCQADGLKAINVDADAVEEVIVPHFHYDHVGNFDKFP